MFKSGEECMLEGPLSAVLQVNSMRKTFPTSTKAFLICRNIQRERGLKCVHILIYFVKIRIPQRLAEVLLDYHSRKQAFCIALLFEFH